MDVSGDGYLRLPLWPQVVALIAFWARRVVAAVCALECSVEVEGDRQITLVATTPPGAPVLAIGLACERTMGKASAKFTFALTCRSS